MSATNSKSIKETQTKKAVPGQMKKTKGEIKGFDRATWKYLKKEQNLSEQEILGMNIAMCPAKVGGNDATLMRFFKSELAKEKGGTLEDYESLNAHPEWILYEGYRLQGSRGEIVLKKREGAGTSFLEEKINNGSITDIGLVKEKTAGQKFLSGFGRFLMMGGFMLILILGVIIAVLCSVLFKC
jgi:hypothetical protein